MTEVQQMESIFSEARSGISEINTGTEDILSKILNIHDLSTQSKTKMTVLHDLLAEFATQSDAKEDPTGTGADSAAPDADAQDPAKPQSAPETTAETPARDDPPTGFVSLDGANLADIGDIEELTDL